MRNVTYAVPDLHGADDLFERGLSAIERHAAELPAGLRTAVFLGDYVDRGPGGRFIIERLMKGAPDGWRWMCLKGNHEDMMVGAFNGAEDVENWLFNGGDATLSAYPFEDGHRAVPDSHLAWLEARPLLTSDTHRVYVHAGVAPAVPLEFQDPQVLLWSRASNRRGHRGRFVVHGHTPHPHGPVQDGSSINLDTLAWHTGRLCIAMFGDEQAGGPQALLEVLRTPA